MGEIVLTRIDDRLIHGQVMTAWVKKTHANQIIIVDDGVAKDMFLSEVMKASAPVGVDIKVSSCEESIEILEQIPSKNNKTIILSKSPEAILFLLENGIELPKVIIGGMGLNSERKTLYKNIAASEQEREQLKSIIQKGTKVSIHIVPSQNEVNIDKYI